MKRFLKWSSNIIIGLLVLLVILSTYSAIQSRNNPGKFTSILGYRPMSVLTGSMRPVLEPGDMIVAKKIDPEEVKVNDVITYKVNQSTLVTHRVVEVVSQDGKAYYRTKGDANNVEDNSLIPQEKLVGRLVFNIPKGGYIANFLRSPLGFVLLILLPLILLLGGELKNLLSSMTSNSKKNISHEDSKVIK